MTVNANAVGKHYSLLTPEERFRLIVAAGARGDHAEQGRLVNAGERIALSSRDHAPFAHAFAELELHTFIELLEECANYHDAFDRSDDAELRHEAEDDPEDDATEAEDEGGVGEDGDAGDLEATADADEKSYWERFLDIAMASGFGLKVKADGWKLFCERMNIPPFALWECLPGFDRLQRALALAEKAAFVPEGMIRWLKSIRPEGKTEPTVEMLVTAKDVADGLEKMFRDHVEWWGG